ncbi:hypothetical protein [Labedaea rhizosphaerae]|uniref:hypothetical protein n=1 Tax=Labedaea rhizosphaerae TaxID=598644 RepID=UPI00105C73C5|nr:hypothetical protein [Labedaea rhizosphaerae]
MRWYVVVVVAATVLAGVYFAVAEVADPASLVPGTSASARVFGAYTTVRAVVLLAPLVWFLVLRRWAALRLMLLLNGVVQLLDTVPGLVFLHAPQVVGPAVFAVALLVAARLLGRDDLASVPR